eukprot:TRINITY_DN1881_c1_g1_i7.p1 TRINITY_DN1881_c1_g1~~TRINITY_DN1881_c1_g1_i7.p1  ORF type:complete len:143 (+),score=30.15 TRINITY_DN1881_c1_g1_i7:173-601(+)
MRSVAYWRRFAMRHRSPRQLPHPRCLAQQLRCGSAQPLRRLTGDAQQPLSTHKQAPPMLCSKLHPGAAPPPAVARVQEYITPEAFEEWQRVAEGMGFKYVASGPMVRSSYKAGEFYIKAIIEASRSGGAATGEEQAQAASSA